MIHKEREDDLIFKNRKSNRICMHDEMALQYASKGSIRCSLVGWAGKLAGCLM